MKLDLTRLPVAEGVIGFLVLMTAVAFILAFGETSGATRTAPAASGTPAASGAPSGAPGGGGEVAVSLKDNVFEQTDLSVKAGQAVTLKITNGGSAIHNMHIASADGSYKEGFCNPGGAEPCSNPNTISPGQTATIQWTVPNTPGKTIPFRCDFHQPTMAGTIKIQ